MKAARRRQAREEEMKEEGKKGGRKEGRSRLPALPSGDAHNGPTNRSSASSALTLSISFLLTEL